MTEDGEYSGGMSSSFVYSPLEKVQAERNTTRRYQVTSYEKLVVPVSMRSRYWQCFGFPADQRGQIISRSRIVCILCRNQIAYNRNTSNLRMHLSNKHPGELAELENASSQEKPHRAVKREKIQEDPDDFKMDDDDNETIGEDPLMSFVSFAEPEEKKFSPKKVRVSHTRLVTVDVPAVIYSYIVEDLQSPDIVNGVGFQRLVLNIENPCSLPSKHMLMNEIIPQRYSDEKRLLVDELAGANYMSLAIEEWNNNAGTPYASLCVHFLLDSGPVQCKMLKTFPILEEMGKAFWEKTIEAILEEFRINTDNVTAVLCPMERENIVSSLQSLGLETMPCLHHTFKECVREVFNHEVISDILSRLRKQLTLLKTYPQTAKTYKALKKQMRKELVLDVEAVWLSTLEMLDTALEWKDSINHILEECFSSSMLETVAINDDEWEIISDLVGVLQPLRMALMSVCEQKPYISLVRPMLYQVIENKLAPQSGESETITSMKKAVIEMLKYRYNVDKVVDFLDTSTIVDPRFKLLPHFTVEERVRLEKDLFGQIKDIVVTTLEEDENDTIGEDSKNLSNMALLFGTSQTKKVEIDSDGTSKLECQTYLSNNCVRLDMDPLEWWSKQQEKYPRLAHLARKYLSLPAVSSLPDKRTPEQLLNFHKKRSTLEIGIVDKLLFLHVNRPKT